MKRSFLVLFAAALLLVGACVGIIVTQNLLIVHWGFVAPGQLFSAERPLPIPSLQELTVGATTDDAALAAVVAYFDAHQAVLAGLFAETDLQRLRALYAMYVIHVSHLYGVHASDGNSFLQWLQDPIADCSSYAVAQGRLLNALGVPWRLIDISGGTHAFVEALIGAQWEYFDATINVWTDRSAFEMDRSVARRMRSFYTPLLDPIYDQQYDRTQLRIAQQLRKMMPGLGLFFFPKAVLSVVPDSSLPAL